MTYRQNTNVWITVGAAALVVLYFVMMECMFRLSHIQNSRCDKDSDGHSFVYHRNVKTEKWGWAEEQRCKWCGMKRLYLHGWMKKDGWATVFMIRKWWWSQDYDAYYYEWTDENKPERQWMEIKEEDIVESGYPYVPVWSSRKVGSFR